MSARCLLAVLVVTVGCSAVDPEATVIARCPDGAGFASVSPFLEASCGTFDCHGAVARPLRVYGKRGLRFAPFDLPGGADTTEAELDANRRSLCSLEPELTSSVAVGSAPPESLLVVEKARAEVHHKGKQIVRPGDVGDVCLTSWLAGKVDAAACEQASKLPGG